MNGNSEFHVEPRTEVTLNCRDMHNRIAQMRSALIRVGMEDATVGTYAGNSSDFLMFCLAAMANRLTVFPLNPAFKPCKPLSLQLPSLLFIYLIGCIIVILFI